MENDILKFSALGLFLYTITLSSIFIYKIKKYEKLLSEEKNEI